MVKPINKEKHPKELHELIEHMNKVNSGDKEEIRKLETGLKEAFKR